jgi:hypothetical protein
LFTARNPKNTSPDPPSLVSIATPVNTIHIYRYGGIRMGEQTRKTTDFTVGYLGTVGLDFKIGAKWGKMVAKEGRNGGK